MADLRDSIRLTTVADLQALSELVNEYKKLGLSISGVAGASRIVSEQMKRDALEQANATKQATLQTQLSTAEIKKQSAALDLAKKSSDGFTTSLTSLSGLRSQLIGLFGAMSIGAFAKEMIDAQSQVEAFELSMSNLLGQKYGDKLVADLKKFTVETPLNFEQVIKSTNQLVGAFKAAGASSETIGREVPIILESLGNSAAALGGGDRLGRLTYAFSQVQATGRLMGTEVRQITETGFPLLAVMSERTGKSVQELQADIKNGQVGFSQFKDAILSAGLQGGVFAGAMDIMANTVRGRLDKLSETFFFASARIGDALSGSAKNAIDFANALIKTLFGTDEAVQRTIAYTKAIGSLILTYTLLNNAQRISAATTAAMAVAEKAWLVIKGEFILLTQGQAAANLLLTETQLEAAIAADTFNRAMLKNPIGLITIAIGTAIAAYQLYNANVEESKELTLDNIKANDADIKNLLSKEARINAVASSLKGLAFGSEGYKHQIDTLIKIAPEYFSTLDREKSTYNDVALAVSRANIAIERKIKLMAMEKLAEKVADRSADIKLQIAQEEILDANRQKVAKESNDKIVAGTRGMLLQQKVLYEGESKALKDLREKDASNNLLLQKVSNGLALEEQKQYTVRYSEIIERQKNGEYKTKKDFTDALKKLNEEYYLGVDKSLEDNIKNNDKKTREAGEKALKIRLDNINEAKMQDDIAFLSELESSRENEEKILKLKKDYNVSKINNAVGSTKQKLIKEQELENKYEEDLAELKRKWNARERAAAVKDEKSKNKEIEKEAAENAKNLWDVIWKRIEDERKAKEDLIKDLAKLDEKAANEQFKLNEDTFKLQEKLRVLEKISIAKNSKEIIDIENQEKEKILVERKDRYNKEILIIDAKLKKLKDSGKTETIEYKELQIEKIKLEQDFTNAAIDLAQFVTEKKKDEIEKQMQDYADAMKFIEDSSEAFFSAVNNWIDKALSETTDIVTKAQLENQKAGINIAKQGISAISSFASGDFVGGFFKAIGTLYNVLNITNDNAARLAKANLEKATELLKDYLSVVEKDVDALMSKFDTIKEVYGNIKTLDGGFIKDITFDVLLNESLELLQIFKGIQTTVDDIVETSGVGIGDLIQGEIARGEQIQKNYEKSVDLTNEYFSKRKELIEKSYDDEVKRINDNYELQIDGINKRYDYEELRANQNYNSQTLGIVAAGTAQLEALITNENVLAEVRAEFAAKRLQIEEAFPLASKKITEGMSQAEVDAINASIKARDDAFAQLQDRYNDELVAIVNSEGQKRKEYTATEKVQNEIQERLNLAAIQFQADEIIREQNRQQDIINANIAKDAAELSALSEKNKQIEVIDSELKANLVALEQKKNKDIADSYTILTQLLVNQSEQIAYALANSAAVGTEAYKELQNQLEVVNRLLDQIRNGNTNTPFTIPTNIPVDIPFRLPTGFEKGTDNTSVSLTGATVDNRGGKMAILHPEEAVFSKADMTQMTRFLGKRPTRDEVIDRFKMGTKLIDSNSFIQKISPYVISKTEVKNNTDVRELTKKIEKLTKEVVKRQQPMVNMDKNGVRLYYGNLNSQIEIKNQKFSS